MMAARRLRALGGGNLNFWGSDQQQVTIMTKSSKKAPTRKAKNVHKPQAASRNATKTSRTDTKSALILKLLSRANGATVKDLATATNWQDHSVRGYLSGTLKRKLGLKVTSEVTNGIRHYKTDRHGTGQ